jgi:magnesium-transporting ATPase (P-type)
MLPPLIKASTVKTIETMFKRNEKQHKQDKYEKLDQQDQQAEKDSKKPKGFWAKFKYNTNDRLLILIIGAVILTFVIGFLVCLL